MYHLAAIYFRHVFALMSRNGCVGPLNNCMRLHGMSRALCIYQVYSIYIPIHSLSSPFFFSLPPSRNSDTGSHSRLFSPLATTVRALHFYCEKISALSSLVDSRRIVTRARRSQQLILLFFLRINSRSRHGGIRTHAPTLVAFEGYHY